MVDSELSVGPHDLLVETECTLVSAGTEREFLIRAPYYPFYPGYSVVGTVVDVGSAVTLHKVGDRVIANCGHALHVVCQERYAVKVPADVRSSAAVFFNIGLTSLYLVRRANVQLGDSVGVVGQGLIGSVVNQVARLAGALPIVGFDLEPSRRESGLAHGADIAVDPANEDAVRELMQTLPGGGLASVIEVAANPRALEFAMAVVRERGDVVAGSMTLESYRAPVHDAIWWKGASLHTGYLNTRPWCLEQTVVAPVPDVWPVKLRLRGEYVSGTSEAVTSLEDTRLFLNQLASERVKVEGLITQRFSPSSAVSAFTGLLDRSSAMIAGVIDWR